MVSIVTGFGLGVSLTPPAYRAPSSARGTFGPDSVRARAHADACAPVVRESDLPHPFRQAAGRGHDQGGDLALVDLEALADRGRRDERAARAVPRERELPLPLPRHGDVALRGLALERGRDDLLERK